MKPILGGKSENPLKVRAMDEHCVDLCSFLCSDCSSSAGGRCGPIGRLCSDICETPDCEKGFVGEELLGGR